MSDVDLERLLNDPIYAIDFQYMIGDLQDFLEFSESNIEWQYRRELQDIRRRNEIEEFPPGYKEHLELNAGHRFKVDLPLRVRYGAVIALTTTVEWSIRFIVNRLKKPLTTRPRRRNATVHMLFELQQRTGVGSTDIVHDYEALVWIRNCIAHSAGIQEYYEFQDELAEAVNRLAGFTLDGWHFLGKHVCIERGALKAYIRQIGDLIVMLYKATDEQGLLHDEPQAAASGREKPAC